MTAEFTDTDAAALLDALSPSAAGRPGPAQALPLPFILPQDADAGGVAFVRAWNDALATAGVPEAEWLGFVDALNAALSAAPPLRVADSEGKGITYTPYQWSPRARLAGGALPTTPADRVLRAANSTRFAPRGLAVRVGTERAVRTAIGLSLGGPKPKGKVLSVLSYLPITALIIHAVRSSKPVPAPPVVAGTHVLPSARAPGAGAPAPTGLRAKLDAWKRGAENPSNANGHANGKAKGGKKGPALWLVLVTAEGDAAFRVAAAQTADAPGESARVGEAEYAHAVGRERDA